MDRAEAEPAIDRRLEPVLAAAQLRRLHLRERAVEIAGEHQRHRPGDPRLAEAEHAHAIDARRVVERERRLVLAPERDQRVDELARVLRRRQPRAREPGEHAAELAAVEALPRVGAGEQLGIVVPLVQPLLCPAEAVAALGIEEVGHGVGADADRVVEPPDVDERARDQHAGVVLHRPLAGRDATALPRRQRRARAPHGLGVGRARPLALAQRADRVELGAGMAGAHGERAIEPARGLLGAAGLAELRAVVAARARVRGQEHRREALVAQRRALLAVGVIELVAVDREVRLAEHRRRLGDREQVAARRTGLAEVGEDAVAPRREVIGIEREHARVDRARIAAREVVQRAQERDAEARGRRQELLGDRGVGVLVGGRRRGDRALEARGGEA